MTQVPTPRTDRTTWRTLILPALRVVDSLQANGYGTLDFRLGGGTVLMLRFDHRFSQDIDVFTYDAQALSFITPRLNDVAAREALHYEEHANTIKLLLAEGDIDFIVAAPVIQDAACEVIDIDGRKIMLEATAEILAKKLLYRADSFKARDVFDMAVALTLDRPAAESALAATGRTRPALLRRLHALLHIQHDELVNGISFTDTGRPHAADMVEKLLLAIASTDQHTAK